MSVNGWRFEAALRQVDDTDAVLIAEGALHRIGEVMRSYWQDQPIVLVADCNSWAAAGGALEILLQGEGFKVERFLFEEETLHADYEAVMRLRARLTLSGAVPLAVGSGTVNDIVKLASEMAGRRYAVFATAASMDGYASYGASITRNGIKQTMWCRAPRLVVADPDILRRAPIEMTASGYADLLAKLVAGGDWILAEALGVESINRSAWQMVQGSLREWTSDPEGIATGSVKAVTGLFEGLIFSGLAMQAARSSRPASGAEHLFSHLWEMEGRGCAGVRASHGFKVGIGTLASARAYAHLTGWDGVFDSNIICEVWPTLERRIEAVRQLHRCPNVCEAAVQVIAAKHPTVEVLRERHACVLQNWPTIKEQLKRQVPSEAFFRERLKLVGAPIHPCDIGVESTDFHNSYARAGTIRERYTVLDFTLEVGLLAAIVERSIKDGI
jgi:glycerol-1-phosphate dehydrogenase [NAD(P)+]